MEGANIFDEVESNVVSVPYVSQLFASHDETRIGFNVRMTSTKVVDILVC